jgi:hypothetical protein
LLQFPWNCHHRTPASERYHSPPDKTKYLHFIHLRVYVLTLAWLWRIAFFCLYRHLVSRSHFSQQPVLGASHEILRIKCERSLHFLNVLPGRSWGGGRTVMLRLYRAFVRSKIDYGIFVYGSAKKSKL